MKILEGMMVSDLKYFNSTEGSVYHGLRNGDGGFDRFGEVYFSTVNCDSIKAWKLHKEMILNLIVPIGKVRFHFLDDRSDSKTFNHHFGIELSQTPYQRLTVPPGIWFGFKGIDSGINMICNVASIPHDPEEMVRKKMDQIYFDWNE